MVGFLYGQTEYSILENAISLNAYVEHAANNKFSFLTITDNNLSGFYKFYLLCKKNNIKPIFGLKTKIESTCSKDNYILLYAKNAIGFKNLMQLSTLQSTNGIVKDEEIKSHKDGLFLVTSSLDSNLEYFIFEQEKAKVSSEMNRLLSLTNELYYGIMPSSFMFDSICFDIKELVLKYNLKIVPLAKCSYLSKEDEEVYQALLKIRGSQDTTGLDDLHLKNQEELILEFKEYPEVFINLEELINSIGNDFFETAHKLPKYKNKASISSSEFLKELSEKGLNKRIKQDGITNVEVYYNRLKYELEVINKMGYQDYFLIVFEFVSYAKKSGILVGPGRGSGASSLVSYSLGIVDIDPIKYGLMFERFLNIERITMPDIDLDFPDDKRDMVVKHVAELYGENHICFISTFNTFQLKSSINELFKAFGYEDKYAKIVASFLAKKPSDEEIKNEFATHPEILKAISIAKRIEGLPRTTSTHAAGVIFTDENLDDVLPLKPGLNGLRQAQIEATELEKLGFLKIDFLSLKNLALVDEMIKEINKHKKLSLRDIPLDDDKTLALFRSGDTKGIFQFEGDGITKFTKELGPTRFEDIVAMIALYRPGPMKSIPDYIRRKKGEKVTYIHPDLEEILHDTYGTIVYQEQIIRIVQKFGGYSLGEADVLRRAISKKSFDALENERSNFTKRALEKGYSLEVCKKIYDYIVEFADYGFNRSHSVAYAEFAYKMAYIKANYPEVFIAKMLDDVIGNQSLIKDYANYGRIHNVKLLSPNINRSSNKFTVTDDGILLPLNAISNISSSVSNSILLEREKHPFKDFLDFKKRMSKEITNEMLTSLIDSFALDSFGKTHSYMLANIGGIFESYMDEDEMIISNKELSDSDLKERELKALGFNIKFDSFKGYDSFFEAYKATMPNRLIVGKKANVIGLVQNIKYLKTKNSEDMAFVSLNCNGLLLDVVLFTEVLSNYSNVLQAKKLVLINGEARERNGNIQLQAIKLKELEDE